MTILILKYFVTILHLMKIQIKLKEKTQKKKIFKKWFLQLTAFKTLKVKNESLNCLVIWPEKKPKVLKSRKAFKFLYRLSIEICSLFQYFFQTICNLSQIIKD